MHSLLEIALIELADEMREHLSVGFALEHMVLLLQVLLDGRVVLNDSVVDDRDTVTKPRVVTMGVSVLLGHTTVRGPARVRDAERARESAAVMNDLLDIGHASHRARDL